MGNDSHQGIQTLKIAACVVIVAYGIRSASHLLSILLLSLLFAYAILPLPQWLMRRFHFHKGGALSLALLLLIALHVVLTVALTKTGGQMRARLPVYELRIQGVQQHMTEFLARHGIQSADESAKSLLSSGHITQFIQDILPKSISLVSDHILVWFLAVLFLLALLDPEQGDSPTARKLARFGKDVQSYIATTAETGAIVALVNFLVLTVLGVDFALIWALAYFFLHFIPSIGFVAALIPPTVLAFLMLGWKKALLVLGCLILTEILGEYVLNPVLLKKGLNVSVIEVMLSLLGWSFLLGPTGAILSVPLNLALRRFIDAARVSVSTQTSPAASPDVKALIGAQ
jgi:AI-2 transport protein TqsA